MSRNKIEVNNKIFLNLFKYIESFEEEIENKNKIRWITKYSEEDSELFKNAKLINSIKITRNIRSIIIEHNDESYFIISGSECYSLNNVDEMEYIEMTPAIFSIFLYETNINPIGNHLEIKNIIQDYYKNNDSKNEEKYNGHDLESISIFFDKISCFKIKKDIIYKNNIYRLSGILLLDNYYNGPLEIDDENLDKYLNIFKDGSEYIPYHILLNSIISITWSSMFLDIYRCIEQLYSAPSIEKLISSFRDKGDGKENIAMHMENEASYYEISSLFEEIISWKPREIESFSMILERFEECEINNIYDYISPIINNANYSDSDVINKISIISKFIYRKRNENVHFRPYLSIDRYSVNQDDWNKIIRAILQILHISYYIYGEKFSIKKRIK